MKLPASSQVQEIEIFEPKWATREIIIATYKVIDHNVIYFTKDSAKNKYPGKYYLDGKTIRKYPVQNMPTKNGGSIRVYYVPMDEMVAYEGRYTGREKDE